MHAVILLTAMTATTGIFGGHRQARTMHHQGGSWTRPAVMPYAPTCQTGGCPTAYTATAPAYAPAAAPAVTYNSYYYPPAAAATCTTGSCPRR